MREDGGMTLTEFLLARIAEDEADARVLAVGMGPPVTSNPIDHPTRVLAECEAKRLIVEDFEEYARDYREAPSDFAAGRRHAALLAVTRAASVYADHPDYDPGWRA